MFPAPLTPPSPPSRAQSLHKPLPSCNHPGGYKLVFCPPSARRAPNLRDHLCATRDRGASIAEHKDTSCKISPRFLPTLPIVMPVGRVDAALQPLPFLLLCEAGSALHLWLTMTGREPAGFGVSSAIAAPCVPAPLAGGISPSLGCLGAPRALNALRRLRYRLFSQ
jgi:hypothetical protein